MSHTASSLTERYISVAVHHLPAHARSDLATELAASIADQIDARVAAGEVSADAERAVITGLGDPEVLAARYADRPLQLLGPRFYLTWWRLLKLLLWIVVPIVVVIVAVVQIFQGASVGGVIVSAWSVGLGTVVHLFFWTTLVFVILERTGAGATIPAVPWSPDALPEPRQQAAGLPDLIASLVFLSAAAVALVWDRLSGTVFRGDGWLSALSADLWPWWMTALFALIAAEAVFAVLLYRTRRYTFALAAVNAVLALVFAIPAILLTISGQVVNPALYAYAGDSAAQLQVIMPAGIAIGIAGVASWDIIDGFVKARAARRARPFAALVQA